MKKPPRSSSWISLYDLIFACFLLTTAAGCTSNEDITSGRTWTAEERAFILAELERTTQAVTAEVDQLSETQWNFREDPDRWNLREILEHLEMQNQLHYREISVVSSSPEMPEYIAAVAGWDSLYSAYATDTVAGQAQWFLTPVGRYCTGPESLAAFQRARSHFTDLVRETSADFRRHFTFRGDPVSVQDARPGRVRDLHQLLLTGIAHTDRHLRQIRQLKAHPDFAK